MEPHATMAVWEGQMLTVHTSAQLTTSPQEGLARTLNIPKENVRVITRYVGLASATSCRSMSTRRSRQLAPASFVDL